MSGDPVLVSLSRAMREARNGAQARVDAVRHLSYAVLMLKNCRFDPLVEVSDDGRQISLSLDLEDWTAPGAAPDIEVVEQELRGEPSKITINQDALAEFSARSGVEVFLEVEPDVEEPRIERADTPPETVQEVEPVEDTAPEIERADPPVKPAPPGEDYKTGEWDRQEEHKLIEMAAANLTSRYIAQELGRSPQGVARKVSQFAERISDQRKLNMMGDAAEDEPEPGTFRAEIGAPEHWDFKARAINANLNAVGYAGDWHPAMDLFLVNQICAGGSKNLGTKPILGANFSRDECLARWRTINTAPGDLAHQTRLVEILRYRATEGQK